MRVVSFLSLFWIAISAPETCKGVLDDADGANGNSAGDEEQQGVPP